MSDSSTPRQVPPSSAFIRVYPWIASFVVAFAASIASAAPPLPPQVNQEYPGLRQLGEGTLKFIAFHVYDSSLWVRGPTFMPAEVFAIEIRYAMSIPGKSLTERSLREIRGLGYLDEAKLRRWEAAMDRVFPDLKPGDRIVGVNIPGKEARFYSQEKLLGVVEDAEFARAFFGIWLDEKTSEPKLRLKMLGLER